MFVWVKSFIDRIFSVVGAFVFAQLPQFYEVYTQRLAGHLAELQLQIEQITNSARMSGRTLDEYIQQFKSSGESTFANQGTVMEQMIQRWTSLNEALNAMQNSTAWTRPFAFFSDLQGSIAKGVAEDFQPGLSLSLEGGIYALIGIVAGSLVFYLINGVIFGFFRWIFGSGRRKRQARAGRERGEKSGVTTTSSKEADE